MSTSRYSQILGFMAALAAGAFLVNLSSPAASLEMRVGLWSVWSMATTTLVWAGGAFQTRATSSGRRKRGRHSPRSS
jgi:hypothetical protein